MQRSRRRWFWGCGLVAAALWLGAGSAEHFQAWVNANMPTLGGSVNGSHYITVLRVEKVNREKGVIVYRTVRDLKGKFPQQQLLTHVFDNYSPPPNDASDFVLNTKEWNYVLEWAEPGKEAVMLTRRW